MSGKDYIRAEDYNADTMRKVFHIASLLKARCRKRDHPRLLPGYTAALVFQKPSLRTRVTFDLGMRQLGGSAIYLGPAEIALGVRESVYDIAKNLERWVDIVIARVFGQEIVDELATNCDVPVINALSDQEHPCQAMADYFTLYERGIDFSSLKIAYMGDGNNVCSSLLVAGAMLGADVRVACPPGYEPPASLIERAKTHAVWSGGKVTVTHDPVEGVTGANAVYTDIWASMGQEHEAEARKVVFSEYQVNRQLLAHAEPGALIMHDLPAHRGEEITDEVLDSPESVIFDQAENRLHVQKAIILECFNLATEEAVSQ